jgi:membrane protease YdiL (CAAX protease family)
MPPWRLIATAIGWLVLALIAGGATGWLVLRLGGFFTHPEFSYVVVIAYYAEIFVSAGVLLTAAVIHGRIVGSGNISEGLGNKPVARLPLIACLAILIVAYPLIRHFLPATLVLHGTPPHFPRSILLLLLIILSRSIIVPIAEESLYRGWLWTGLQKNWGPLPTALLTSTLFLAFHFNPRQIAVLLPVAIILALARHFGQSVRASITLHILYNFTTQGALWLPQVSPL